MGTTRNNLPVRRSIIKFRTFHLLYYFILYAFNLRLFVSPCFQNAFKRQSMIALFYGFSRYTTICGKLQRSGNTTTRRPGSDNRLCKSIHLFTIIIKRLKAIYQFSCSKRNIKHFTRKNTIYLHCKYFRYLFIV